MGISNNLEKGRPTLASGRYRKQRGFAAHCPQRSPAHMKDRSSSQAACQHEYCCIDERLDNDSGHWYREYLCRKCGYAYGRWDDAMGMHDVLNRPLSSKEEEKIYQHEALLPETCLLVTDINEEIKKFLARHPEKLYDLSPRKFEMLVAEILRDFGFETELTGISRDGGRDIYAYVRTSVTSFLMFVECKRWSPSRKVGIDVVQRVYGASKAGGAHKGMVVTTSFFTQPARLEHKRISTELDLKDYEDLKRWLKRYASRGESIA